MSSKETPVQTPFVFLHCQFHILVDFVFFQDQLIQQMKKIIPEFYSENPVESGHYGRIVNERHFQ